jgi:hypothetical protein
VIDMRDYPLERHFSVPTSLPDNLVPDTDYLPGAEDWAVVESLRSSADSAQERDPEDERFIALMLGGDAFD